jgi:DNA invertase Pin-like site-specific DNA recombinase
LTVKVISYTRFSTAKQAKGHSEKRQFDAAIKWCKDNGYELDTEMSIHDPGFSAYSGANLSKGGLGVLQLACLNGQLEKGTILLIEAFDRLTRLPLTLAYELLLTLINNGLTIVTLSDKKVWNSETMKSLEAFMLSLISLYRGYQESEIKSERLREKYKDARENRSNKEFGSAPGWLTRESKEHPWTVIEEKAEVVRKVFEYAAKGYGTKAIAKIANEQGWIVPTRLALTGTRWHARMPGIILRNRGVLGEHEHRLHTHEAHSKHWKGVETGIVYTNFYPRIISDELWTEARASIETRKVAAKRDNHYYNIFSGIMYCGRCGAPIHRKTEKKGYSRAQLVCADRLAGITKCPSFSAVTADPRILEAILTRKIIVNNDYDAEYDRAVSEVDYDISECDRQLNNLVETIKQVGYSNHLSQAIRSVESERKKLIVEKDRLKVWRGMRARFQTQVEVNNELLDEAMAHMYEASEEARDYRASLTLKLLRAVETIHVWGYEVALIEFKHTSELVPVQLDFKRLPSRANTHAQYHKPPKPKRPPPRPHLDAAMAGTLVPAEPRRMKQRGTVTARCLNEPEDQAPSD